MARGNRREVIFSEAARLFSQQGYAETTIRQVANASRINEATIYIYFKSKADILSDILDMFEEKFDRVFFSKHYAIVYPGTDGLTEQLKQLFWNSIFQDDEFMYQAFRIVCREQFTNEKAQKLVRDKLHGEVRGRICAILDEMIACKVIVGFDTYLFSEVWVHTMFSSAIMAVQNPTQERWDEINTLNTAFLDNLIGDKVIQADNKESNKIGSMS